MKNVSVIVPTGATVLSSIVGPLKVLSTANQYLVESGKRQSPYFNIQFVGLEPSSELYEGIFEIKVQKLIHEVDETDLVIIPAIMGDVAESLSLNADYFPWIRKMYANGAEIASLCMGAFILASTGLTDGKSCTTHWLGADAFRAMFPEVNLLPDKIVTEEKGIYTSGGAYSFTNLLLHITEKYCGREVALYCAKLFEIDIDRATQSQYAIFRGQREHGDEEIQKAQAYIESNVGEKVSVESLAELCALSKRNFIRRFKKATHNTPIEYIQRVKVEAAKKEPGIYKRYHQRSDVHGWLR